LPQSVGDEPLLSLLLATSHAQDLHHLPCVVTSFFGLGALESLGVPGGLWQEGGGDPDVTPYIPAPPQMQPSGFWSVWALTWAWPARKWR